MIKGIDKMNEKTKESVEYQKPNKGLEKKKSYTTPTLSKMGSMQRITQGGSVTPGDSGQGAELMNN